MVLQPEDLVVYCATGSENPVPANRASDIVGKRESKIGSFHKMVSLVRDNCLFLLLFVGPRQRISQVY
jgi:hypothetical protein